MNACVLDASVVAAALFHEEHAQRAGKLLSSDCVLLAPDLIYAELANVIWKRCVRSEIEEAEAVELLADFRRLVLRVTLGRCKVGLGVHWRSGGICLRG